MSSSKFWKTKLADVCVFKVKMFDISIAEIYI